MPIGLFTNPLQMIFSLLLMQGISLTMFRAFLNQAITRSDPMRFSLNLGNTNNASGSSNVINGVPTPIVDPRVMDLLTLIKALTPANGLSNQPVAPAVAQVAAPAHFMSAPLILASAGQTTQQQQQYIAQPVIAQTAPLVHHVAPNTPQMPQIIIIPSLKTSPSEQVAVKVPPNTKMPKPEAKPSESNDDQSEKPDAETSEENNSNFLTKKISNKRKRLLTNKKSKQNSVIIFEAVGVNFRHPNHNYDKDENKEMQLIEIDSSHS